MIEAQAIALIAAVLLNGACDDYDHAIRRAADLLDRAKVLLDQRIRDEEERRRAEATKEGGDA